MNFLMSMLCMGTVENFLVFIESLQNTDAPLADSVIRSLLTHCQVSPTFSGSGGLKQMIISDLEDGGHAGARLSDSLESVMRYIKDGQDAYPVAQAAAPYFPMDWKGQG